MNLLCTIIIHFISVIALLRQNAHMSFTISLSQTLVMYAKDCMLYYLHNK